MIDKSKIAQAAQTLLGANNEENWASYIAAANPAAILELLAENERLATRATPEMKTEADLISWLDSLHECDETGAIVCNWKWEPAQRVISATHAKPVADELLRESLSVLDSMLVGCREQKFGDYENGNGDTIGPRMDALHAELRRALTTNASTEPASRGRAQGGDTCENESWSPNEQAAFSAWAINSFPNESSQGLISLGSAWKQGQAYALRSGGSSPADAGGLTRYFPTIKYLGGGIECSVMLKAEGGEYVKFTEVCALLATKAAQPADPWKWFADKAIDVLQRHIVPDGLSDHAALAELYGIFDGPEMRAMGVIPQMDCDARQAQAMGEARQVATMMAVGASPAPSAKQEPKPRTATREQLYTAVINCPHMIEADRIILYREGHGEGNALSQLGDRLDAIAAPSASASPAAPTEPEIRAAIALTAELDGFDVEDAKQASLIEDVVIAAIRRMGLVADSPAAAVAAPTATEGLYRAVNAMMAHLGAHGIINALHDLVDAVMREMHKIDGGAPVAGSQQVPDGFALVPVKETPAMVDAYNNVPCGIAGSPPHAAHVWEAMLAAAPAVPVPVDQDQARDAARYRWLRSRENSLETRQYDKDIHNGPSCYHEVEGIRELKSGEKLDAAVDAAMAAPSLQQGKEGSQP